MTMMPAACIDEGNDVELSEGAAQVLVHNELVDDGAASLHTLRSQDMTYSVKFAPGEDSLTLTWTIENKDEFIERTVEFEVISDPEFGPALKAVDPEAAASAYAEIRAELAGTDIEARLLEGPPIDLQAGLDFSAVEFRAGICPSLWSLVGVCGVAILSLPLDAVGLVFIQVTFGFACAAAFVKYQACH